MLTQIIIVLAKLVAIIILLGVVILSLALVIAGVVSIIEKVSMEKEEGVRYDYILDDHHNVIGRYPNNKSYPECITIKTYKKRS